MKNMPFGSFNTVANLLIQQRFFSVFGIIDLFNKMPYNKRAEPYLILKISYLVVIR